MKISEVPCTIILKYCNAYEDEIDLITLFKDSAISYIKGKTGLTDAEMDTYEDLTLAILMLICDMYDNRTVQVDKDKINVVLESIMYMHSTNLL